MADKKLSFADKVFLIILLCLLLAISGCASQARQTPQMDSNHYVAVAETGKYQPGRYRPRNYGPTSSYQSDIGYQRLDAGGYSFKENSYGFTEFYWNFHDSKVKSYRVIPRWTNTRYHLVGR